MYTSFNHNTIVFNSGGPSYTANFYSNSVKQAVAGLQSGTVIPIVAERMSESIVNLAIRLKLSLADVVPTLPRYIFSTTQYKISCCAANR